MVYYKNVMDSFIEVDILKSENFLIIKETLKRIGIASNKTKTLFQSCHILHKQEHYYIVHFLEMFKLDGKVSNFTEDDQARRNTIALLLQDWGLLKIKNYVMIENQKKAPINCMKIISHRNSKDWTLKAKYTLGNDNF